MWQIVASPLTSLMLRTSLRHVVAPARCGEEAAHDSDVHSDSVRCDSYQCGARCDCCRGAGGEPAGGQCTRWGAGEPEYGDRRAARNPARHRQGDRGADHRVPPEERRLQEGGRSDERPRHRGKELPDAEAAGDSRGGEGRALARGTGRGYRRGPRPSVSRRSAEGAKAGYTLIELMFVVALAAVVAATAVPQLLVSIDRSRGLIAA